jgi:hypothetical protein
MSARLGGSFLTQEQFGNHGGVSMETEIQDHVISANLHQLEIEHQTYDRQLERLQSKPYLSEDDKIEEVRLKKLKLHLKDKMTALRHQYSLAS